MDELRIESCDITFRVRICDCNYAEIHGQEMIGDQKLSSNADINEMQAKFNYQTRQCISW